MKDLPMTPTLLTHLENGILSITLNSPQTSNALSQQMVEDLHEIFQHAEHQRDVRVLILRGAGDDFCAGIDVKDLIQSRSGGYEAFRERNRTLGSLLQRIQNCSKLSICLLTGQVLGGGLGLACVCDIALASESACLGLPEISWGLIPAQVTPFLVDRIGLSQARRLILTGCRISAREALQLGLIHYCETDAAALEAQLRMLLIHSRQAAPQACALAKILLASAGREGLDKLLDRAAEDFAGAVMGQEGQEGIQAFIGKRPPSWAQD